jgi:hypothetical protein
MRDNAVHREQTKEIEGGKERERERDQERREPCDTSSSFFFCSVSSDIPSTAAAALERL